MTVEPFDVRRLRLVEVEAPQLSLEEEHARDRVWEAAVEVNPCLFDGPVVACAGLETDGAHGLILSWARVTYRHFALRRVLGNTSWLPSLFVDVVQPTDDGRILVGQGSSWTAAPGRWQLPGGSVEPPEEAEALDEAALRRHAARELVEETGVDIAPEELRPWVIARSERHAIGFVFLAPPRPETELREHFEAMTTAERALGRDPELNRMALVRSPAEVAALQGPHAYYLEAVVRRCAEASFRGDVEKPR